MKTTNQKAKSVSIQSEIIISAKKVLWNSRRRYSFLTQYKFNN